MKTALMWGLVAAAALFAVWANSGDPERSERMADRDSIRACWEFVDDELQELAARRAMRTECGNMERRFRHKWRVDP